MGRQQRTTSVQWTSGNGLGSFGVTSNRRAKKFSFWSAIRRAYAEFLTFPTIVIAGFLALAAGTYALDKNQLDWLHPLRHAIEARLFTDAKASGDLLSTIAGSIITVTSITISLLLVAVQQAAGTLAAQVYDQFLRRKQNQLYFGFFIGLALYSLVTLATVAEPFNPVFGATLALILTVIALCLLIVLLYTTINQMRPVEVVDTIHDLTLASRQRQRLMIERTRPESIFVGAAQLPVTVEGHGYVTNINLNVISKALQADIGQCEIVMRVSIGSYMAYGDILADVAARSREDAVRIGKAVLQAVRLERQRDISCDPGYGIQQLSMIAWTSISTAKSNPDPGLITVRILRDLLARWTEPEQSGKKEGKVEAPLLIVYTDNLFPQLIDAFESLAVVASESMQHQTLAEIMHTFGVMFHRLSPEQKVAVEKVILRSLSGLGEHILTATLDHSLSEVVAALKADGRHHSANAVQRARDKLAVSIGELHARSTRVEASQE